MPEMALNGVHSGWVTVSIGDVVEVINDYWIETQRLPERLVAGAH